MVFTAEGFLEVSIENWPEWNLNPRPLYVYNRTSCAQVHELPQSHCGDNREGTLFS